MILKFWGSSSIKYSVLVQVSSLKTMYQNLSQLISSPEYFLFKNFSFVAHFTLDQTRVRFWVTRYILKFCFKQRVARLFLQLDFLQEILKINAIFFKCNLDIWGLIMAIVWITISYQIVNLGFWLRLSNHPSPLLCLGVGSPRKYTF